MNNPPHHSKHPVKTAFTKILLCTALIPLLLVSHASGALITWNTSGTVNPLDESTVSTNGTSVTAVSMSNSPLTTTVNGVTFKDYASAANISGPAISGGTWFYVTYPTTPAYAAALGHSTYALDGDLASNPFVFTNLTIGQQYEVQVWTPYWDQQYNSRYSGTAPSGPNYNTSVDDSPTLTFGIANGVYNPSNPQPQYAIGSFIADGTTQNFYVHGDQDQAGNYFGAISALQLRAVPEPTTWALVGLGGLTLMLRRKFRRRELVS